VRYRRADGEFAETTLDRVVPAEVVAGLPVREFRWYKGRQHYSGWYWSATMNGHVVYESRLELARIMLADFDPAVAGLAAQPFQLTGPDGGRDRRHVPDLLLAGGDGAVTVVDVKAASRLRDPEVRAQFSWTRAVAASRGWGFEAWSGAGRELLDNVRFLAGYRRGVVISAGLLPVVLDAVREQATIGSVERALAGEYPVQLVRPAALHLLWTGRLRADLRRPLGAATPVRLALAQPGIQALATAHAPDISGPASSRSRYRDRMPITLGPDAAAARQAASLFRELANPTRLAILLTLQTAEQRITDLAAQLGGSQANISAHLIRLRQSGLITSRTQGRAVYYRLTQPELGDLLQAAGQLLAPAGQQAAEENDTTVRKTQPTNR
jgi:DNA-binding transcriptional ArsR family regulator